MVRCQTSSRILQSNESDRKLLIARDYCSSLKGPAPNITCPWKSPGTTVMAPATVLIWLPSEAAKVASPQPPHKGTRNSPLDNSRVLHLQLWLFTLQNWSFAGTMPAAEYKGRAQLPPSHQCLCYLCTST